MHYNVFEKCKTAFSKKYPLKDSACRAFGDVAAGDVP